MPSVIMAGAFAPAVVIQTLIPLMPFHDLEVAGKNHDIPHYFEVISTVLQALSVNLRYKPFRFLQSL